MQISALRFGNLMLALALLALTACGFHLRGQADLAFQNLYMQGATSSQVANELRRLLKVNGVKVVPAAEQSDFQLDLMGESLEKRILSLSGGGKVREFELLYRVNFRTKATGSELWGPVQTVEGRRDYSYDDTQLLAKEGEEARLNNDMRSDAVREIMRRLSAQQATARPDARN